MYGAYGNYGNYGGYGGGGGSVLQSAAQADILQWLNGIEPDDLTLVDRKEVVVPTPEVRDVACLSLTDSDTQSIDMGTIDVSTWTELHLKGWFKTDTDSDHIFTLRYSGGDDFRVTIGVGGSLRLRIDDGTVHEIVALAADYSDDAWHYFEAGFAGTTSYLNIEAETKTLGGVSFDFAGADGETRWGSNPSGVINNWNGELSTLELSNQDGLYSKLPLQEGSGDVAYDTSGNGNNGVVKNGTGTIADMRIASDGIPSHNHGDGFSQFSDTVSIPLYYNDAVMASVINMDDMYLDPAKPERWDNFTNMAEWLTDAQVVPSSGIVTSSNTDSDWGADATAEMISNALHFITHHSYSHPLLWPDTTEQYTLEYVTAKDEMLSEVSYPDLWSYKGSSFITTAWQWGGWGTATPPEFPYDDPDDPAWDEVWDILAAANYLSLRNPSGRRGISFGYPLAWNYERGIYDNLHTTSSQGFIINGSGFDQDDWDHAYANSGYYYIYIHPYLDTEYYAGSNSADWTTWINYIKEKTDVWYTDTDSFINYKYMRDVNPPVITSEETNGSTLEVVVTGDGTARARYGLSTPMTYKILKPAAWASAAVTVKYSDAENPTPTPMKAPHGADQINNGTFDDSGSGWFTAGDATINTGVGRILSADGIVLSKVIQNLPTPMIIGQDYTIEYDITDDSGGTIRSNAGAVLFPSTLGHHVFRFTADETQLNFKRGGVTDISIDNISLVKDSDLFTAQNNFRDAGAYVYVSQGLPQESDSFTLTVELV